MPLSFFSIETVALLVCLLLLLFVAVVARAAAVVIVVIMTELRSTNMGDSMVI